MKEGIHNIILQNCNNYFNMPNDRLEMFTHRNVSLLQLFTFQE